MPVRTRSSNGRFESSEEKETTINTLPIQIPKGWILRLVKLFFLVFVVSPWVFMFLKNRVYNSITQKVTEFYDDNFSCNSSCEMICPMLMNSTKAETDVAETKSKF
jgi:hypothetical protein